ncbi:response regulator [Eggerthellaceae bacterium zg-893]|nr:response regulator [Eggerthellaceae bacterium zg-893]
MNRILLVEDDGDLARIVARYLEGEGMAVRVAPSAEDAYDLLTNSVFDLVVLDINLPGDDGLSACRNLRAASDVPIIFATARVDEGDRVAGLDLGGDGYLSKPYSLRELRSYIEALLRRFGKTAGGSVVRQGPFELDTAAGVVRKAGEAVALAPKEFALAAFLMTHEGETLSKERLISEVWGAFCDVEPQTVAVHMSWLRSKLEDDPAHPKHFLTVHGRGYRFVAKPNDDPSQQGRL